MTRSNDLNNQIISINESLLEIKKDNKEIKDDILKMKDEIIKNLLKKNLELSTKVSILEEKIEKMEIKNDIAIECNNQYVRRNNIEISGIPNSVVDDALEDKVISILEKIDVKVSKNDIEACHRLPASKKIQQKEL